MTTRAGRAATCSASSTAENGGSFCDAIQWACRYLGLPETEYAAAARACTEHGPQRPAPQKPKANRKQPTPDDKHTAWGFAEAHRRKTRSTPLPDTLGERYLTVARGIPRPAAWPEAVRFDLLDPSVVFSITDDAGQTVAVQVVRLTPSGKKIPKDDPRPPKQTYGERRGNAVRLPGPAGGPLLIAEGPETGLTLWAVTGFETWIGCGSMASLTPPRGRRIVVCRDDDPRDAPSQKPLRKALAQWKAEGLQVATASPWPQRREDKTDFNDVVKGGGASAVRYRIGLALGERPLPRPVQVSLDNARAQLAGYTAEFFAAANVYRPVENEPAPVLAAGASLVPERARRHPRLGRVPGAAPRQQR